MDGASVLYIGGLFSLLLLRRPHILLSLLRFSSCSLGQRPKCFIFLSQLIILLHHLLNRGDGGSDAGSGSSQAAGSDTNSQTLIVGLNLTCFIIGLGGVSLGIYCSILSDSNSELPTKYLGRQVYMALSVLDECYCN